MIALWITLGMVWGGIWWRLRGGAFTALTGIDPGTGGMRFIAAVGMTGPFLAISGIAYVCHCSPSLVSYWQYVALIPMLWITWSLAGWGAFQRMGIREDTPEVKNPVARLFASFGWRHLAIDLPGMALEGLFCTSLISVVPALLTHRINLLFLCGVLFAPLYLIPIRVWTPPSLGRFATGGEWAEVLVGALIGAMVVGEEIIMG